MKRIISPALLLLLTLHAPAQIISQYIETSSGSTPKGVEIWNNTLTELNFNTNNLVIEKGTNGAIPSADFTLTSGTLASGEVIVIGTSDLQAITETNGSGFHLKAFTYNGDDAIIVKYGGVITDCFGIPGNDPGTAWTGNGVSTANQNISIKEGIETGDTDGWNDPSERFSTTSTDNSVNGFGIAPILITGILTAEPASLNNFSYVFQCGPSASQSFTISGSSLTNNVLISPPAHYEISTDNISFQDNQLSLAPTTGTLHETQVYARLKTNLKIGQYNNESIIITSVGVVTDSVHCNGRVKYSDDMSLPNAWINEFHYDNEGPDENEFIEIAIENASFFDLSDFTVSLYNGGNGTVYDFQTVNFFTPGANYGSHSIFMWAPESIQNGSPDGISIDYKGEAILLVSYEGIFTATSGPAFGLTSADTGISENSTNSRPDHSIQLIGTGNQYSHFRWIDQQSSPQIKNTYQFFDVYAPPVPVNLSVILFAFLLCAISISIKHKKLK